MSGGLQLIVTGAGVLFLLLVFPGGLGEVGLRIRRFGLDLIARRRGLDEGRPPAEDVSFDRVLSSDETADTPDVVVARAVYDGAGEEVHSDLDDRASFLSARGLDVAYGSLQVLFGVDFDVRHGEVVALLGTNGAGKSTLVRALSGLSPPRRGTVTFDGHDITGASPEHLARLGIAHAPGGRGVYPGLTVGENLRLAMWTFRSDKQRCEEATERVFELFPILRERAGQSAGLLSGGQQQMLALAQALAPDPRLLIIDELSLGLAPTVVEELLDVVAHLKGGGLTTILVEQSVTVALHVASRAVFLEKGTVRFSGATADLAERDDLLRSVFLEGGGRRIRPRRPKARTHLAPPARTGCARSSPATISRSASEGSPPSTVPG